MNFTPPNILIVLDIFIVLIVAAALLAILTRRDPRVVATLSIILLLSLAFKEWTQNYLAWAVTYALLAIILAYKSRPAFIGDKKGQWRRWPWY